MGNFHLDFDESLSGLLDDGVEGTPFVGATMRIDRHKGLVVEIPYLLGTDNRQFEHVRRWFTSREAPTNMELLTPEGCVSLFGITWLGHRESYGLANASIGRLQPSVAVFDSREGSFENPLLMDELYSWVDGLNDWSELTAVSVNPSVDERNIPYQLEFMLGSEPGVEWVQGDARIRIQPTWSSSPESDGYRRKHVISDNVSIVSSFDSGSKCFEDHYREQQKVRHFMTFMYGRQLYFRRHALSDDQFSYTIGDGKDPIRPRVELVSSRTCAEFIRDVPSRSRSIDMLASLQTVEASGMKTWGEAYCEWERFILPSVNVLGREGVFMEDVILSTSMSMEAAGELIGERDGEGCLKGRGRNLPIALCVYRCLHVLDLELPSVFGGLAGMSKAIANTYNAIKHSSRGKFPDAREVCVVCDVNKLVVRLLALYIAEVDLNPRIRSIVSNIFDKIVANMSYWSLSVDGDGKWCYGD